MDNGLTMSKKYLIIYIYNKTVKIMNGIYSLSTQPNYSSITQQQLKNFDGYQKYTIQTLQNDNHPYQTYFGYASREDFFKSFYLSVKLAKNYFNDIKIYTDELGHKLLEPLNLDVKIIINLKYSDIGSKFYSLAKIQTFLLQKEPFLHLDFDLFLLDNFDKLMHEQVMNSDIITLNSESNDWTKFYLDCINDYLNKRNIPIEEIDDSIKSNMQFPIYNNGIFGGNNIEFLHEFCNKLIDYLNKDNEFENPYILSERAVPFLEQFYFSSLARKKQIDINTFADKRDIVVFYNKYFVHLLGQTRRRDMGIFEIDNLFRRYCPKDDNIIKDAVYNSKTVYI